jgi:hypothetical protein
MLALIAFALLLAGNIIINALIEELKQYYPDIWQEYGKPTSPTDIRFVSSFIFFSGYKVSNVSTSISTKAFTAKCLLLLALVTLVLLVLVDF